MQQAAPNQQSKYILIGQCFTARLDFTESPRHVRGLATNNLNTCVAVIIYNDKRVSLTHVDAATDLGFINREVGWVGDNAKVITVQNKTKSDKIMLLRALKLGQAKPEVNHVEQTIFSALRACKGLKGKLKTYLQRKDHSSGWAVYSRDNKLTSKALDEADYKNQPEHNLANAIMYVNAARTDASYDSRLPLLAFNGQKFEPLPALTADAMKRVSGMDTVLTRLLRSAQSSGRMEGKLGHDEAVITVQGLLLRVGLYQDELSAKVMAGHMVTIMEHGLDKLAVKGQAGATEEPEVEPPHHASPLGGRHAPNPVEKPVDQISADLKPS